MKAKAGDTNFELEVSGKQIIHDGKTVPWDLIRVKDGIFHVLLNGKSYNAEVLQADTKEKLFVIRVNGNKYTITLRDKYDELLHSMGMDNLAGGGMKELKAPMPGLVIDIRVTEGQEIKKGDGIVVLEAMKMENVLKAQGDAVVKKVHIQKGMTVDKNQILISF